jgi:hypothetical protein
MALRFGMMLLAIDVAREQTLPHPVPGCGET